MSDNKIKYHPLSHPYAERLNTTLANQKELLQCLENRIVLINQNGSNKSEFELNENRIVTIESSAKISAIKNTIKIKEEYFREFMRQLMIDLEDCDKNFDKIIKKAKKSILPGIKLALDSVKEKWDLIESNIEFKVTLYKHLKKLLYVIRQIDTIRIIIF